MQIQPDIYTQIQKIREMELFIIDEEMLEIVNDFDSSLKFENERNEVQEYEYEFDCDLECYFWKTLIFSCVANTKFERKIKLRK